jgi:small GTP-binding protein
MIDQAPKVVLLGDTAVGKTSVIRRLQGFDFSAEVVPTIGAAYGIINLQQGPIKLWDTAGQETFRALTPMYYRSAHLVLLVFAVNLRETFLSLPAWIKEIQEQAQAPGLILVGNKIDTRRDSDPKDCVDSAEAATFAEGQGAEYLETSCKTGEGIDTLLGFMADAAYRRAGAQQEADAALQLSIQPINKECSC